MYSVSWMELQLCFRFVVIQGIHLAESYVDASWRVTPRNKESWIHPALLITIIVSDPMGEVRKLYDFLGMNLTSEVELAMNSCISNEFKIGNYQKPVLEQRENISRDSVERDFKEYLDLMSKRVDRNYLIWSRDVLVTFHWDTARLLLIVNIVNKRGLILCVLIWSDLICHFSGFTCMIFFFNLMA